MSNLPELLQYRGVKPRGFPAQFKRWQVMPQTSYNTYSLNDVIRVQFQTNEFIDPYNTYLEVEVTFNGADYTDVNGVSLDGTTSERCDARPLFMLDGPATSLINEMVVYSNSKEIERVMEYDQLGNILAELGYKSGSRLYKPYAGLRQDSGIQSQRIDNLSSAGNSPSFESSMFGDTGNFKTGATENTVTGFDITKTFSIVTGGWRPWGLTPKTLGTSGIAQNDTQMNAFLTQGTDATKQNLVHYFDRMWPTDILSNSGYSTRLNPRMNFATLFCDRDSLNGVQGASGQIYEPGKNALSTTQTDIYNGSFGYQTGYCRPFCGNWGSSSNMYIAPYASCLSIVHGKFLANGSATTFYLGNNWKDRSALTQDRYTRITKKRFYIPILSGVLGTLIPKDDYKLIPGKALGQMLWEFRMNPYAFFASGHKMSALDGTSGNMQSFQHQMKYNITFFAMNFDLWTFDQIVTQQIDEQLRGEGLLMTSQGFSMGPIYTIANTQNVKNNWHINNGILSLRSVIFWFLDNRYQQYSSCRKNFRLSHNLRSMQLKVGSNWIPQTPIQGHAGNLATNEKDADDYQPFYIELQRSFGNMFSVDHKFNISPEQYVINDRPYDPTSFWQTFGQSQLFQELRCQGKALYAFDLTYDPHGERLSGIDTTQIRPIELVLDVNSDAVLNGDFNGNSTMFVLLHHDVIVQFKMNEVVTVGYG